MNLPFENIYHLDQREFLYKYVWQKLYPVVMDSIESDPQRPHVPRGIVFRRGVEPGGAIAALQSEGGRAGSGRQVRLGGGVTGRAQWISVPALSVSWWP